MHKNLHTPLSRRKKIVLAVGALLFVVVVATGVAFYLTKNASVSTESNEDAKPVVQTPVDGIKVINQAKALAISGDVQGANKVLDAAIAASSSPQEKSNYYSQKATNSVNSDLAASIEDSIKSVDLSPTAGRYAYVAELAEMAGNKDLAIEYYEKAAVYDKEHPSFEAPTRDATYFQSKADALRAQ